MNFGDSKQKFSCAITIVWFEFGCVSLCFIPHDDVTVRSLLCVFLWLTHFTCGVFNLIWKFGIAIAFYLLGPGVKPLHCHFVVAHQRLPFRTACSKASFDDNICWTDSDIIWSWASLCLTLLFFRIASQRTLDWNWCYIAARLLLGCWGAAERVLLSCSQKLMKTNEI